MLSATIPSGSGSKLKIHDIRRPMKLLHFGIYKELLLNEDILSAIGHLAKVLNSLTSSLHIYQIIRFFVESSLLPPFYCILLAKKITFVFSAEIFFFSFPTGLHSFNALQILITLKFYLLNSISRIVPR